MANINHKDLTDPKLHEPKGVATAASGAVYVADGAGTGAWSSAATVKSGVYDYNDLATTASPIALSVAGTFYDLTNDGAGADTNLTYALSGVANVWYTATGRFDFTGLSLGDVAHIRVDVDLITTSANTAITLSIESGLGATPYTLNLVDVKNFKAAGTYNEVITFFLYMGNDNTRLNPAKIKAKADATGATVTVNGWAVNVITRA